MTTDLRLTRTLSAPRALVWRCWTEPELLTQWFVPAPHQVTEAVIDLRPGGRFFTVMLIEGEQHPGEGSYLEVVPETRLVFTDLLEADWLPAAAPGLGFTAALTLSDAPGGGTAYQVIARHRSAKDAEQHEAMGFTQGWGTAADQLDTLAQTL